jgi:hypothetical protein
MKIADGNRTWEVVELHFDCTMVDTAASILISQYFHRVLWFEYCTIRDKHQGDEKNKILDGQFLFVMDGSG